MKNKIKLTKREKQQVVTKHFMEVIDMNYGIHSSDNGEAGTINFSINDVDSNGDNFHFKYRRSYQDVLTWCMKDDRNYDRAFDLECEMQSILAKIIMEVENA